MADDVRVKLSAEGVADVVAAFRTVSNEGKKSAKETESGFAELGDSLKELGVELAGFLAIGALFDKFKESIAQTFERADQIDDFTKATGLSTEAVQGLTAAATKANVPFQTLESSTNRLTATIGKARQGAKDALAPFDELGINFAEFQKLSPDQQFQLVAEKLGKIKNPADQAAVGMQLFGKQFADLKPLIDDLNKNGLQSYIDHMRELGILLDSETVDAMKHVGDQLNELKARGQGAATQFVTGLVPALNQTMDTFLTATNDGLDGVKTVGEGVGNVLKGVALVAVIVGKTIGSVLAAAVQQTKTYLATASSAVTLITSGNVRAAGRVLALGAQETTQNLKQLISTIKDEAADATKSLFGDEKAPAAKEGGANRQDGSDAAAAIAQQKALGQARFQLISAQLDSELALYQAHAALLSTQEKQDYDRGKLSLAQYYTDRAKIINDQYDKEIDTLRRKAAAAAAVPTSSNDPAAQLQRQAQVAQVQGQIALKEAQRQQALAENTQEQREAQRQLYTDQLTAEARLATLQGRRYDASRNQLAIQLQQLDDVLRKGGIADAEREKALDTARQQGEAMAEFSEQQANADAALRSLSTGIAGIQGEVANGTLFPVEGEERMIELERERLPLLEKIAQAQLAAAEASKDPQALAAAEQYAQKVRDIATSTDLAGQRMAEFKAGAQNALQDGLANWLSDGIQEAHNLGDAFKSLVVDVLKGIQRIAAQLAAEAAVKAIIGAFTTGYGGTNGQGGLSYNSQGFVSHVYANGGAFLGGSELHAFAAGGAFTNSIAMRPTVAPMAMFGEAGPEAIMPLVRDGSGQLGVKSSGGSGGDININSQWNIDSNGAAAGQTTGDQTAALRQFNDRNEQQTRQLIAREMLPGGLLWKWRNGQG